MLSCVFRRCFLLQGLPKPLVVRLSTSFDIRASSKPLILHHLQKTWWMGMNMKDSENDLLAARFNFKKRFLANTYLEAIYLLSLGFDFGKGEEKLSTWENSFCGRLTLIQATLSNVSIYFLSTLSIPSKVAKDLERILQNFLWKGTTRRVKAWWVGTKFSSLWNMEGLHQRLWHRYPKKMKSFI